jgi:RND family efflux transporter MFP subunit
MIFLRRNWHVLIIIAVLVVAGIVWNRNRIAQNVSAKIELTKVEVKDLSTTISPSGKTEAKNMVDLHFQTLGRLAWVGVKEGDHVEAYQTLASLDVQQLQKTLEKELRDYASERNDFDEAAQVTYKDKAITDTVKRILEKNQWDLEQAVLDVELQTIAKQWSYLITPIAGTVTHIDTPIAGVNITSADTFTVADLSSIIFSANVDEIDIGQLSIGMQAIVSLDAFPDEIFTGTVSKIAYSAETSAAGATVFPVEITFDASQNIRLGLNGDVEITLSEHPSVLSIPDTAVRQTEDETFYSIKKTGNKFEKVDIEIGAETDDEVQIVSGLSADDEVVIAGFEYLPKELQ